MIISIRSKLHTFRYLVVTAKEGNGARVCVLEHASSGPGVD